MAEKDGKLLIGVQAILDYLQISEPTFRKFVGMGLPAVVIDRRWYAHTDNLDAFFKKITLARMRAIPEHTE